MEKIIIEYIEEKLNQDVIVKQRLLGGMSNFMFVVDIDNDLYTFRIPGKNASEFVDRKVEIENINHLVSHGLVAMPDIFDVKTGYKLTSYIEGNPLNEVDNIPYDQVVDILKRLHATPKFIHDYDPINRLEKFEKLNESHSNEYLDLKNKWLNIYEEKLKDIPLVACHGDAQISNFVLDTTNQLHLLDWEFAGNNDLIYDIACFGNNDFNEALKLLEYYFTNPTKEHYQRLYAWRMFQCLQWHNVAMYKHQIGLSKELLVDFDFVSKLYIEKATNFYEEYLKVL